jgi:hypothetical protein
VFALDRSALKGINTMKHEQLAFSFLDHVEQPAPPSAHQSGGISLSTLAKLPGNPETSGKPEMKTLADLLAAIELSHSGPRSPAVTSLLKGMRKTAKRIAEFLKRPLQGVLIHEIVGIDADLRADLESNEHDRRNASQHLCDKWKLLQHAKAFGWSSKEFSLIDAWEPVRYARGHNSPAFPNIVNFAIALGRYPSEFSEEDMAAWKQDQLDPKKQNQLDRKRSWAGVRMAEICFRSAMRKAGLQNLLSRLNLKDRNPTEYAMKFADLPSQIQSEIEAIERWKTKGHLRKRDAAQRIRMDTWKELKRYILQLCGYVIQIRKRKNIRRLTQVITKHLVCGYIDWLCEVRRCKRETIRTYLTGIHALTQTHELFEGRDYRWLTPKLRRVKKEPSDGREERKRSKQVPYERLKQIPKEIQREREAVDGKDPIRAAWLAHDQLLMTWFLYMPWRQRNIRECRLYDPCKPNLREKELPIDFRQNGDVPDWVEEALKKNQNRRQKFWQFFFTADETKAGRGMEGIVPRELVSLLVEYKERHRKLLAAKPDPGTLFLNRYGNRLTAHTLRGLVSNLTVQYASRRVTPHVMRDIYSYEWLRKGGSIETLSGQLWHSDIRTTWVYCKQFTPADAMVLLDEWLYQRKKGRKQRRSQNQHELNSDRVPSRLKPAA